MKPPLNLLQSASDKQDTHGDRRMDPPPFHVASKMFSDALMVRSVAHGHKHISVTLRW